MTHIRQNQEKEERIAAVQSMMQAKMQAAIEATKVALLTVIKMDNLLKMPIQNIQHQKQVLKQCNTQHLSEKLHTSVRNCAIYK